MARSEEQKIHRAVVQHLRTRAVKGLVWFHPPNGGFRTRREGAIFKSLGVRPGVSDLILLHVGKFYALEIKAELGRLAESQMEFLSDVNKAGGFSAVAHGLDRALACLEMWGCLKRNLQ